MSDHTLPAMHVQDFSKGILCGIVEIAERRSPYYLQGWQLLSRRSDAAAAAVYKMIDSTGAYDLRFHIVLHEIHHDSPVWRDAVRSELYVYGTLRQWVPYDGFEILVGVNNLEYWLTKGGLVGTRELWITAAEKFVEVYENYTE